MILTESSSSFRDPIVNADIFKTVKTSSFSKRIVITDKDHIVSLQVVLLIYTVSLEKNIEHFC